MVPARLLAAALVLLLAGCTTSGPDESVAAPGPGDSDDGWDRGNDAPPGDEPPPARAPPGDAPPSEPREPTRDGYNLIVIRGNFSAEPPEDHEGMGGVCGYPSPPELDPANRSLRFLSTPENLADGEDFPLDAANLTGLVLFLTWDSSGCGVMVTRAWPLYDELPQAVDVRLPDASPDPNPVLRVRLEAGGAASLPDEGVLLEPGGERVAIHDSGESADGWTWNATYEVGARGFWPAAGMTFQND